MTDEPRYTLLEAKRALAAMTCATHGHDFHVEQTLASPDPHGVVCTRCGKVWSVTPVKGP